MSYYGMRKEELEVRESASLIFSSFLSNLLILLQY